ncbi:MAG: heparan-alpha-glucosaminide N-acetyltransferase domain-containing protein [Bacteroidota bacterium]|nr:heparan-alpha-glucosaminide N-acetyltransferase domain-containing protein [Bacteroidota bacterium]
MESLSVPKQRIYSIDILRGVVMLIMALDHVRDFFHITAMTADPLDLQTTTPALFFTRWITHFCAPVFVFLSGTSAYLASRKRTKREAGLFLIRRGIWLIMIEVTVMTFAITFNPFFTAIIFQVIWAIGCSMVLLGLVSFINLQTVVVIGFLLVFGHNILDFTLAPKQGFNQIVSSLLFTSADKFIPLNNNHFIFDLYAILPWTGIMFLGYAFGTVYKNGVTSLARKKILRLGIGVTLFFIVIRFINSYGDPFPWLKQRNGLYTLLSFVNVTKYPPSLCYTCMTLGPAMILLSWLDDAQSRASRVFRLYGSVPFFYYVLHFYLIHLLLLIFFFMSGYGEKDIVNPQAPFLFRPQNFGFHLPVVYLIWLFVIVVLYSLVNGSTGIEARTSNGG